jgi:hypothetical protein
MRGSDSRIRAISAIAQQAKERSAGHISGNLITSIISL